MYRDVGYYDKALSLARELLVAFCLNARGGGIYDDNDEKYKECDEGARDYLKESRNLQYRNILMHGSLSKDLKTEIREGIVELKNEIKLSVIEDYVKQQLEKDYKEIKWKILQP